jgi:hypothetical protein
MSNITQNGGIIYIQQSGNDIQYQSNSTSGSWTNITSFPVSFINSNPVVGNILTISLITNLTIGLATGYFICGSSYITFDGTGKTVTIDSVTNYLGLIQNGTNLANGYSNITVKNINNAISGTSTLVFFGGWICQRYFGKGANNILINNCSNSGIINTGQAGGICGDRTGINGSVSITNCSNSGVINGEFSGGICGSNAGRDSGNVLITNCSNSGAISGSYAGGICGTGTGYNNGTISISNCSNSGAISGQYAGGITGAQAGNINGIILIINCSNSGIISGISAGGITGNRFGNNTNNLCSIINCYNTGSINGSNAGGITGSNVGYNSSIIYIPKILIQNCYSLGNIATTAGGICGGTYSSTYINTPIVNITNCYTVYDSIADINSQYIATSLPIKDNIILTNVYSSLTNAWSDTNASSALSGALSIYRNSRLYKYYSNFGEVWYSNQNNTPFSFTSELNTVPRRQKRD